MGRNCTRKQPAQMEQAESGKSAPSQGRGMKFFLNLHFLIYFINLRVKKKQQHVSILLLSLKFSYYEK